MEHYGKRRTLCRFIDDDRRSIQSPTHLSFKTHHEMSDQDSPFSPARPSTPASSLYSLLPPPSPDSPWRLSPLQTPSPSLLFHCVASLHRQEGNIYSIAIISGGSLVFTGSDSSRIRAWRQPDCSERGYLKASSGEVRAMLAYGTTLFTSHRDFKVRIWDVGSPESFFRPKQVATIPRKSSFPWFPAGVTGRRYHHKDCVSCMAYYQAEGILYTGSWDKTVKAWRVSDSRCVDSFTAHDDIVNSVVVNQEDGCVFTCSSDGSVRIWRRLYGQSTHILTMTLKYQPSPVNAIALSTTTSSTSCFLYSGSSDGFVNFWEKEKISSRFNHGGLLQGHRFAVLCLVAIEKLIFSGSEDTTIRVWRREEESCFHECLAVLDAHRGPVRCLAASMEIEKVVMGFLVYSAGLDQTFKAWRVKVLPDEKMSCLEVGAGINDLTMTIMESEMMNSSMFSSSWVQ